MISDENGQKQTGYQIQIAGSKENFDSEIFWDIGKIDSENSVQINYSGSPLESGKRYFWRVKIWEKLIAYHDGVMRLYHIPSDIGEKKDLSKSMPKRVSSMKNKLAKWRFKNIPDRYDTSKNLKYKSGNKNALPPPKQKLFVRSPKLKK